MNNYDAAIDRWDDRTKAAYLTALIKWADTPEGADYRASLAHGGKPSPVTAEDVLSILDHDTATEARQTMGNLQ